MAGSVCLNQNSWGCNCSVGPTGLERCYLLLNQTFFSSLLPKQGSLYFRGESSTALWCLWKLVYLQIEKECKGSSRRNECRLLSIVPNSHTKHLECLECLFANFWRNSGKRRLRYLSFLSGILPNINTHTITHTQNHSLPNLTLPLDLDLGLHSKIVSLPCSQKCRSEVLFLSNSHGCSQPVRGAYATQVYRSASPHPRL